MTVHLERELDRLKKKILALGAIVEERVRMAIKAMETRDRELAKKVIEADDEIDQIEVDVEEGCLKILALYQPVAIDLRFIVAVIKINNDLERRGDIAGNIAERAAFRARTIGFVFQTFHLVPYLSVLENVLLPTLADAGTDDASSRAQDLLEHFGLTERTDHRPSELSIGERQRVAMARALLNQPRLLLADEPTGNLDPANATQVMDYLAEFHRAGGTVLVVTHERMAQSYAQRTVKIEAGKVAAGQV